MKKIFFIVVSCFICIMAGAVTPEDGNGENPYTTQIDFTISVTPPDDKGGKPIKKSIHRCPIVYKSGYTLPYAFIGAISF